MEQVFGSAEQCEQRHRDGNGGLCREGGTQTSLAATQSSDKDMERSDAQLDGSRVTEGGAGWACILAALQNA